MRAHTTRNESYLYGISLGSWLHQESQTCIVSQTGRKYGRVVVIPMGCVEFAYILYMSKIINMQVSYQMTYSIFHGVS